jgi:hypothetical protein
VFEALIPCHTWPHALGFPIRFSKEEFSDFRQLHGHNGDANEAVAGVANLNPRANGQWFSRNSKVVEYSSQFNDSMVTARSYA